MQKLLWNVHEERAKPVDKYSNNWGKCTIKKLRLLIKLIFVNVIVLHLHSAIDMALGTFYWPFVQVYKHAVVEGVIVIINTIIIINIVTIINIIKFVY